MYDFRVLKLQNKGPDCYYVNESMNNFVKAMGDKSVKFPVVPVKLLENSQLIFSTVRVRSIPQLEAKEGFISVSLTMETMKIFEKRAGFTMGTKLI